MKCPDWDISGNWKSAHENRNQVCEMTKVICGAADTVCKE